jgi:ribosomal protein L11 methyltransferase
MNVGWRLALTVPAHCAETFVAAVEPLAPALSVSEVDDATWRIDAYFAQEPERGELIARIALAAAAHGLPVPSVTFDALPRADWVKLNRDSFRRIDVGRLVVLPSFDRAPVPPGRIALVIDAGMAFGSGDHGTTKGCLIAMQRLKRRGARARRLLDLGCGSAILAIAAARLWPRGPLTAIRAADVDHDAIRVARENIRRNAVTSRIVPRRSSGRLAGLGRRYDLIVANILARPLVRLAGPIARAVRRGGRVVLSGLLVSQQAMVLRAYRARRLAAEWRWQDSGWATIVLRRR